jgi:hypothetical protein
VPEFTLAENDPYRAEAEDLLRDMLSEESKEESISSDSYLNDIDKVVEDSGVEQGGGISPGTQNEEWK